MIMGFCAVKRLAFALSFAWVGTGTALAATDPLAIAFGARPAVEQVSLSPDGTRVAVLQPQPTGQGSVLYIANVDGKSPPRIITRADGKPNRLSWCRWTGNARLVCQVYNITQIGGIGLSYTNQLIALNDDGSNVKAVQDRNQLGKSLGATLSSGSVIDWHGSAEGHILLARQFVPESSSGTKMGHDREGLGVDDLDTASGKVRLLESPRTNNVEFISDGMGAVRIMGQTLNPEDETGYTSSRIRYFYRDTTSRDWKRLSDYDELSRAGFNPHFVDPIKNVAYGLKPLDGRLAAYSIALDGSLTETLLFASPVVDVDGFVTLGRNRRVVGVSYVTDIRRVHYFDPTTMKLHRALSKAIPNLPLIEFIDSSEDGNTLLLSASSDTDAGRMFVFDQKASTLNESLVAQPALEGRALAKMIPVSIPARDGVSIPAYLTLPPGVTQASAKGLPAIVMPHGGPSARDEWGFDWLVQFYAAKGFAVLQPNFRGSEGYGDAWFARNGFQNWKLAIGDVTDAGKWLVSQGIAAPEKLGIFGWSYGGYAALQSAATEPALFKAVVAVAPVTDLGRLKEDRANFSDYRVVARFVGEGPHVAEGSPARQVDSILAPVLLFHGTLDRNVAVAQSRMMQDRLKGAGKRSELVIFDGLDHYLQDSTARADMLEKSAAFLLKAGQ
jgi:pimeloyl-ACP methyl ester carboxylesterase